MRSDIPRASHSTEPLGFMPKKARPPHHVAFSQPTCTSPDGSQYSHSKPFTPGPKGEPDRTCRACIPETWAQFLTSTTMLEIPLPCIDAFLAGLDVVAVNIVLPIIGKQPQYTPKRSQLKHALGAEPQLSEESVAENFETEAGLARRG